MTSSIIPLVTPADKALAKELGDLWADHLFGEISTLELRKRMEVRLATHRLSALLEDNPMPPRPSAPYWKGKRVVGESPCDIYHWRKCE